MVYLLVRMLLLAFGRGRPREPLRILIPTTWLAVGLIFLVGFRIGLNVTNSNVIDVGYAGVIGADKVLHDHAAVRALAARQPCRRHLRPGQLLPLHPVPPDLGLERALGQPAGRARGGDHLRPPDDARAVRARLDGPRADARDRCSPTCGPRTRSRSFVADVELQRCAVALLIVVALLVMRSAAARGVAARWPG